MAGVLAGALSGFIAPQMALAQLDNTSGAQGRSPLSRVGVGDLFLPAYGRNHGMGVLGVGLGSTENVSHYNPSWLSQQRVVNLEVDTRLMGREVTDRSSNTLRGVSWTPTLFALTLPVTPWLTVSGGLRLYSSLNYSVLRRDTIPSGFDTVSTASLFAGRGSLSQTFLAVGARLPAGFGVGLRANYQAGTLDRLAAAQVGTSSAAQDLSMRVSGIYLQPGAHWRGNLSGAERPLRLGIGATAELGRSLRTDDRVIYTRSGLGGTDTIDRGEAIRGAYVQPSAYAGGVSLERPGHWSLAADVRYQRTGDLRGLSVDGPVRDAWLGAVGMEWIPNRESTRYFDLVAWRAGARVQQMPFAIEGRQPLDASLTFGVGLPVIRKEARYTRPIFNAAITAGQRATIAGTGIRERYVMATLSVVLNDNLWFVRFREE